MRLGRNDPCSCGSGKKYKNCCLNKAESPAQYLSGAPHLSGPSPEDIDLLGTLFNTGHYEEQENLARTLLKSYPDSGVVWKLFGLSLQMRGKDALHALRKAAELLPNDAEAHGNLAAALRAAGRLEEAVASGRRALHIKPDFAAGHNNLGVVLQDLGRLAEAAASYRRALEIKPDFAEAHNNLGGVLKEQGLLDEALESYRRALQIKPDFSRAHSNMGVVMRELGLPEDELECYRLALHSDPLCSEALLGLGQLCLASGEIAEAAGLFRKALEIKPDDVETRFLLTQIGKVKAGDENYAALAAMKDAGLRNQSSIPYKKVILMDFALGKCLDDLGDPDRAFPHFLEGCKLKRATVEYDAGQTTRHFDDIMRVFDTATLQRLSGGGDPSGLPIFVLGMPRSGTTLTEQIIASHPEVHGAGELPDLLAIAHREVAGAAFPDNIAALDQAGLGAWGADYVAGLQRRAPDARRITDKMPANFMAIGLIHLMLPNAKIIHVNRNPVDTCLSCFMQLFSYRQEQSYDLAELGRYYVDYARLMAHWRSVLPAGSFLEVQYEDIVADQESQARRMIAHCGLDWDDACLDFHDNKRSVRTASVTQVRQPIYRSSVERWRPYEKFLGPLLDALGDLAPG
jgi:tetratricopeptide (TPR) repeat protein